MFSIRMRSSSCCLVRSFFAVSAARSCLILFSSANRAAVSSSSESVSEFSLSTGSSASRFCGASSFCRLVLPLPALPGPCSRARRAVGTADPLLPCLLSRSRFSSSSRKSRLRSSSLVLWPWSRYFSFVCPGRSRLLYCLERALRSFSPRPLPPRAGSNVGRAAVVMVAE
uniref:Uncharacterized protein n=1 Tax=Anopheles merus TaxID=30066 RepID=A0A182VC11_ANOME